ncbi:E3 ubiquitin-protein ligase PRT1 [Amaranthus tricolor]|uniref:E3 ubiquitin-protein ligase PRT1 n=1 Tax=Amaranthus tricolor TaxID=29722 RepID=UPI00258E267D|nr:E3 ubiquitin-protein ligase PRT1 [Amaranthus tricolor]
MAEESPSCFSLETDEESVSDSFVCCVCLDLLYKPIVLECGHASCFWCVHKSMDSFHESHCPICRHPYHHFPTICEMLHFLLLKMYPLAYRRREKQILVEEKKSGYFSPQLDCKELNESSKMASNGSSAADVDRSSETILMSDVLCPACKQLLYRPVVLNCGHVYCEVCIEVPEDGNIVCKVCECPQPRGCPNVCLEFNNIIEERFPKEYATRRGSTEQKQSHFQQKNPSNSAKRVPFIPSRRSEDFIPWWNEHASKVHVGVGCDCCGMYPIVGDRYRCQDCVEHIGFDLCGDCYNSRSKRPGRFNQQHTSDHRFQHIKQSNTVQNIMLRLVGGHLVDDTGVPILAVTTLEDHQDGWIAVESVAPENTHDNVAGDIIPYNSDVQEESGEVEIDGLDIAVNNSSSPSNHDHIAVQDDDDDDPTF